MKSVLTLGVSVLAVTGALAQAPVPPSPWTPPTGIPAPPFGIVQVAGQPTHYVDNSHSNATDTGNTNGTPTMPRRTVPTSLAAGSVVQVRGGPYSLAADSSINWTGSGTAAAPVFIRGEGNPVFRGSASQINLAGSHFVIEGLIFESIRFRSASSGIHHFVLRYNEVRNWSGSPTPVISLGRGVSGGASNEDVVIFANHIHHNGDYSGVTESDTNGIVASTGSLRTWILDNHIHHNGADSIRTGTNPTAPEPRAELIYIGRNELHDNGENAIDVKQCRDIIISQNLMYNLRTPPSASAHGEAIVTHYNAERVWINNNWVRDSDRGIVSTGATGYYVIGNLVTSIHEAGGDLSALSDGHGIMSRATDGGVVLNNTVWGVDGGISQDGSFGVDIVNNIVGALPSGGHHLAWGNTGSGQASTVSYNLLGGSVRIQWGSNDYSSISSFQSGTGKGVGMLAADPSFATNHVLSSSSPARNAGSPSVHPAIALFNTLYPTAGGLVRDRLGVPWGYESRWDIGAFEYGPGGLRLLQFRRRVLPQVSAYCRKSRAC